VGTETIQLQKIKKDIESELNIKSIVRFVESILFIKRLSRLGL